MGRLFGSLAVFVAVACLSLAPGPAPQARQGSLLPSYAGLKAEMAALEAEAAAPPIEPFYCPPPKPPSKREHEALLESIRMRGEALQQRFNILQTAMKQQATSPIYGPMYSAAGADPNNPQYFQAGRQALAAAMAEIARKQAQLDRTATRPCNDDAPPRPTPPAAVATGPLTADEEAAFADFPLAVPTFAEVAVPVPPRFCSFAERNAWTKDVFWPAAELAKQNALKAIDAHARAEARLRTVIANDRDGSPRIEMARRSVEAWRVEKDRRMAVQQRILAIDIPNPVDCREPGERTVTGPPAMATAPDGSPYFNRPILSSTFLPELPPCFRDEADRRAFVRDKYFPTVERSLQNGQKGADYLWKLGEMLKDILRDHSSNSALYKATDAEFRDYEAVQARHKRFHDQLTGLFHARIAALPICNLERPREVGALPGVGGQPALPPPALGRPTFERVADVKVPPKFCSEFERNAFLTEVYNPAVASALNNARAAQAHQARLNGLFTEHMRANSEHWAAVRAERDAYEPIANAATAEAERLRQLYAAIMAAPVIPCGADSRPPPARVGDDPTPVRCPPKETGARPCPRPGRDPIQVGSNGQVGSGAQLKKKLGGMAMGALAGALGGGGGGGGGSGGPDLWTCKIKDSEMTVFDDPGSGVSLKVGAKRDRKGLVIFSEIARSPDKGTFQTAFLERPDTAQVIGPKDVGPCDLWGEWKLTVSWTRDTYVDGQLVDHQEGGWSEGGKFSIPGVLSRTQAPDGLWRRMGFSNASNGARKMAAIFDVARGSGPMTFVIHVTRPRGDPVTTVPFVLTMTEGPGGGFVFAKAPPEDCPRPGLASGPGGDALAPPAANPPTEVRPATTEPAPSTPPPAAPPPASDGARTVYHPPPQKPPSSNLPDEKDAVRYMNLFSLERANALAELLRAQGEAQRKALDTARCEGPQAWEAWRAKRLERLKNDIKLLQDIAASGRDRDAIQSVINDQIVRLTEEVLDIEAMKPPQAATSCPPDGEFRSILDSIDEVLVPS